MRPWFKAPRIQSPEMRQLRRVHGSLACFHLLVIIDLFSDIGAADIDAAFIVEYCKVKFKTAERWLPYFQNILLAFAKQNQNKSETKPKHNGNITETESKHNQNKTVLFDLKPSNSLILENASLIEENRIEEKEKNRLSSPSEKALRVPHPIWDDGLIALMSQGDPETSARSFLGRALKEYGEGALSEAISACILEQPVNFKAFLLAVLKKKPKLNDRNGQDQYGRLKPQTFTESGVIQI